VRSPVEGGAADVIELESGCDGGAEVSPLVVVLEEVTEGGEALTDSDRWNRSRYKNERIATSTNAIATRIEKLLERDFGGIFMLSLVGGVITLSIASDAAPKTSSFPSISQKACSSS
jgi:hypothetical protein